MKPSPWLVNQLCIGSLALVSRAEKEVFIKPGPGLPSLESLGITPSQLYNMTREAAANRDHHRQDKRWQDRCTNGFDEGPRFGGSWGIQACGIYLERLGRSNCQVRGKAVFCSAHHPDDNSMPSEISGWSTAGGFTSSWCEDVAAAVTWAWACRKLYLDAICIAAQVAARGNGDLIVDVGGPCEEWCDQ
jgi:hypothetical protein